MEQRHAGEIDEKTARVRCDVRNCVYHTRDYLCEAGEIKVGPHYAKDTGDTICATFKQKK